MPVGTSGYPATPIGAQTPIPNYLVWSILVTIFCFLPTGIAAIVFSTQVDSKLAAGTAPARWSLRTRPRHGSSSAWSQGSSLV